MKRCMGCMRLIDDNERICPYCGYIDGIGAEEAIHMQPGTLLSGRYTIGKVLGFGGFGVTYIGFDEVLQQRVAIKEYLPSEFSTRVPGKTEVLVFEGEKEEQYRDGMKKFVDEARRLARFQNEPGVVRIFDAFEENSTAYIVMEYLEGETLTSYLNRVGTLDEDTAVSIMTPIMESLEVVHGEGLLHRDIAPDNIFLTVNGEVKLIDFGASRYATTSHSRSLTVIIKPGFSPEEQYRSRGDQGPHTDVYALAATLYKMITGKTPPDALERRAKYESKNKDLLIPPHKLNKKISAVRENAILNALNVRIEDRTPTVAAFLQELNAAKPVKRVAGKIRKVNLFALPLWVKIAVPTAVAAVIAFFVLMALGVIHFSRFNQDLDIPEGVVSVPEVEGMTVEEAIEAIEKEKLLASTSGSVMSAFIPAGTIVYQTPTGGAYSGISSTVYLTVSSGKDVEEAEDGIATVPYLIWETKEAAIEKLKKAGLGEPIIEEAYDENVEVGQVISQSIDADEKVKEGTVLTLTISLGKKGLEMPDLTGKSLKEAREILANLGLKLQIQYEKDTDAAEDEVLKQSVKSGSEVKRGQQVTLTLATSGDIVKVPDVSDMEEKEAEELLKDKGFKVKKLENYDDKVKKGFVISQEPEGGSSVKEGSEITLYVSKGSKDGSEVASGEDDEEDSSETESSTPETTAPTTTTAPPTTSTVPPTTSTAPPQTTAPTSTAPPSTTAPTQPASEVFVRVTYDRNLPYQYLAQHAEYHYNGNCKPVYDEAGNWISDAADIRLGTPYMLPDMTAGELVLLGWFTAPVGGTQIVNGSTICSNGAPHAIYAHWQQPMCTVRLDPAGGSVSQGTLQVGYYDTFTLPTPVRDGYIFNGWAYNGQTLFGSNQSIRTIVGTPIGEITLTALWSENETTTEEPTYKYSFMFDPQGGTWTSGWLAGMSGGFTHQVNDDNKRIYDMVYDVMKEGYSFGGWYSAPNGEGTMITPEMTALQCSQMGISVFYVYWVPEL